MHATSLSGERPLQGWRLKGSYRYRIENNTVFVGIFTEKRFHGLEENRLIFHNHFPQIPHSTVRLRKMGRCLTFGLAVMWN